MEEGIGENELRQRLTATHIEQVDKMMPPPSERARAHPGRQSLPSRTNRRARPDCESFLLHTKGQIRRHRYARGAPFDGGKLAHSASRQFRTEAARYKAAFAYINRSLRVRIRECRHRYSIFRWCDARHACRIPYGRRDLPGLQPEAPKSGAAAPHPSRSSKLPSASRCRWIQAAALDWLADVACRRQRRRVYGTVRLRIHRLSLVDSRGTKRFGSCLGTERFTGRSARKWRAG